MADQTVTVKYGKDGRERVITANALDDYKSRGFTEVADGGGSSSSTKSDDKSDGKAGA